MLTKGLIGVLFLGLAVVITTLMMPSIVNLSESARTTDVTDSGTACATGSDTYCIITLSETSQYSGTSTVSVIETSPASGLRDETVLADDRVTLTVNGLTTSTSYIFDVTFKGKPANVSDYTNDLLRQLPLIIIIGTVAIAVFMVATTLRSNY